MNNWNISGEVLRHGIKGSKYPKLWIQVELQSPIPSISENKLFISFDLDPNPSSKAGKAGEYIKNKLENSNYFFLQEGLIAMVQTSKKLDNGEWQNEDVIGFKGRLNNLSLSNNSFDNINMGLACGIVSKYNHDQEKKIERFIIEEKYRNVKTGEWKSRPIPILREEVSESNPLIGKKVFVFAKLCGATPEGEAKIFGLSKKLIIT